MTCDFGILILRIPTQGLRNPPNPSTIAEKPHGNALEKPPSETPRGLAKAAPVIHPSLWKSPAISATTGETFRRHQRKAALVGPPPLRRRLSMPSDIRRVSTPTVERLARTDRAKTPQEAPQAAPEKSRRGRAMMSSVAGGTTPGRLPEGFEEAA
jgi:hypothetical protein